MGSYPLHLFMKIRKMGSLSLKIVSNSLDKSHNVPFRGVNNIPTLSEIFNYWWIEPTLNYNGNFAHIKRNPIIS